MQATEFLIFERYSLLVFKDSLQNLNQVVIYFLFLMLNVIRCVNLILVIVMKVRSFDQE